MLAEARAERSRLEAEQAELDRPSGAAGGGGE